MPPAAPSDPRDVIDAIELPRTGQHVIETAGLESDVIEVSSTDDDETLYARSSGDDDVRELPGVRSDVIKEEEDFTWDIGTEWRLILDLVDVDEYIRDLEERGEQEEKKEGTYARVDTVATDGDTWWFRRWTQGVVQWEKPEPRTWDCSL